MNKMEVRCNVENCKNTNLNSARSFFKLPRCKKRAALWEKACGRNDPTPYPKTMYRVCSKHFERRFLNRFGNRVLPDAVPTIFPSLAHSSKHSNDHKHNIDNYISLAQSNESRVSWLVVEDTELPPLVPIKKGSDVSANIDDLSARSFHKRKLLDDKEVPPLVPIKRLCTLDDLSVNDVPPLVPLQPTVRRSEISYIAGIKSEERSSNIKTEVVDTEFIAGKEEVGSFVEVALEGIKEEILDIDEKGNIQLLVDNGKTQLVESGLIAAKKEVGSIGACTLDRIKEEVEEIDDSENYCFDVPEYVMIKRQPRDGPPALVQWKNS